MKHPISTPARSFEDALQRIQHLQTHDDDSIHPASQTRLWSHGTKTTRAVLYLQGYTDSVQQFAPLGDVLFARGYTVFAPRLPYHGYKDRMNRDHGQLTIPEMLEWTNKVTDIGIGLGEQLTVMGLSLGGVLATWVAQYREVERVLLVAPAYGIGMLPWRMTKPAAQVLKRLPNLFMWWDPRVREQAGFEYTYPRFATRTLAQVFILGSELEHAARNQAPAAHAVWMITNANDFAVSNRLCDSFVQAWRAHPASRVYTYQFPRELNIPHDIMDPADPLVDPHVVYPPLLAILEQALPLHNPPSHK